MIAKYRAIILLFSFASFTAIGQPTLPDIAGSADKGIVVLSWNCQYNGLKAISVMRSSDSLNNYSTIGTVKQLEKGLQAFVDGHPASGKNFYKLIIVFRSGLTWTSNHCNVFIDKSLIPLSKQQLPSNDSLQHFVVTEENAKIVSKDGKTNPENTGKGEQKRKISISFGQDITLPDLKTDHRDTVLPAQQKHKITISFDDPDVNPAIFIKSQYIYTDPATGHINMSLPDDATKHNYSVKFYSQQNRVVIEVPKIKASKIIFDRRNFQHKGVYKFILRRDVTELETGYITIN